MYKRLTIKDIYDIKKDAENGLTQQEIATLRGISRQTVNAALRNRNGVVQRQIADRYEYFHRAAAHKTGNLINGHDEIIFFDSVVDELIALEEVEEY